MNEFGALTNRKRALIALIHSVVFLGIAIHGFVASKQGVLQGSGRIGGFVLMEIYLIVACILYMAGKSVARIQGAHVLSASRRQRDLGPGTHGVWRSNHSASPVLSRHFLKFISRYRRADGSVVLSGGLHLQRARLCPTKFLPNKNRPGWIPGGGSQEVGARPFLDPRSTTGRILLSAWPSFPLVSAT